jgi:protein-S-isoprenylcysteine O-methyltransferase Ste14
MKLIDVFIILVSIIVTISGFVINFTRKIDRSVIVKTADDSSLLIFRLLIPLGLVFSLILYFLKIGHYTIGFDLSVLGVVLIILGLFIRWFAVKSLGVYFRVKVSLIKEQKLITHGIYKYIRHPSYTGLLMYYMGLGLLMSNYYCQLFLFIIPLLVVLNRIKTEEAFLINSFKDNYSAYQTKSYKLFPFIY